MEAADARKFLQRREEDTIRKEVDRTSRLRYGVPVKQLSQTERVNVATDIWKARRTFSVKQLARLTRLEVELLRIILHQPVTNLE